MNDETRRALNVFELRLEAERLSLGYNERQFALYLSLDPSGYWRIKRGERPWGRLALERVKEKFPELVSDGLMEGARLRGPGASAVREQGKRTTKIA